MFVQTASITIIALVCVEISKAAKPIYVNRIKSDKTVGWHDYCDEVEKELGGFQWLPPANFECFQDNECNKLPNAPYYDKQCMNVTITKSINVFKENRLIRTRNREKVSEDVFDLKKVKFYRSAKKDGQTSRTGSYIWRWLNLTDTDELRTHLDPSEGEEIAFDSTTTHIIEKLDALFVFRKRPKATEKKGNVVEGNAEQQKERS